MEAVCDVDQKTDQYVAMRNKYIISVMPEGLRSICTNYLNAYKNINEIRIRLDCPLSFTVSGSNIITGVNCKKDDILYIIDRITEGNYFKNEEIMRSGYITLPYGLRAGVCGDVFVSNGSVKTLKTVSYINFRLPSNIICTCDTLIDYISDKRYRASVLVISPPASGKTTLLRSVAYVLSSPPHSKRVSVIDTNRELCIPFNYGGICEYLSGYPKAYGINIAVKYMNPEYIICDEIGAFEEAQAITELQHSGVPLIASAHGELFSDVMARKNLCFMIENGVFDAILKIKRSGNVFEYDIKNVSDI